MRLTLGEKGFFGAIKRRVTVGRFPQQMSCGERLTRDFYHIKQRYLSIDMYLYSSPNYQTMFGWRGNAIFAVSDANEQELARTTRC
jgi:hypothetical protein